MGTAKTYVPAYGSNTDKPNELFGLNMPLA